MPKKDQISQIINLIFTLRKLTHGRVAAKLGKELSYSQLVTLHYIRDEKPLMKDLADFLAITPPSATSFVDTLVKAGLAKRIFEAGDRRTVRIAIAKKGERYLKLGMDEAVKEMRSRLERLTAKEHQALANILEKLAEK